MKLVVTHKCSPSTNLTIYMYDTYDKIVSFISIRDVRFNLIDKSLLKSIIFHAIHLNLYY